MRGVDRGLGDDSADETEQEPARGIQCGTIRRSLLEAAAPP